MRPEPQKHPRHPGLQIARESGDSSLNSTIQELPGSGWLVAEPKATPQMPRLRPWGFPTVSPSHPSLFPHHGIRRITVEFSEDSRIVKDLHSCPAMTLCTRPSRSLLNAP